MNAFHGKSDFTDVIKVRILRWEDVPRLSGWVQCIYEGPYKGEAVLSETGVICYTAGCERGERAVRKEMQEAPRS